MSSARSQRSPKQLAFWFCDDCLLPSLKLTASLHLKMDGWNTIVSFRAIFRGHVSFREGNFFFGVFFNRMKHRNFDHDSWACQRASDRSLVQFDFAIGAIAFH